MPRPEVTGRRRVGSSATDVPRATPEPDTLAGDLLRGCKRIAAFLDQPERQTYHQLINGFLPAVKVGQLWIGSKSRLRRHFQGERAR